MHYAVLILGLILCASGIWSSGREGLSILINSYASATNQLDAADRSVRLSPSSPEAHYLRASLLSQKQSGAEAVRAYEQAAALRPRDYVLWLELGLARDRANDNAGALTAFRESTRLAPFYASPRWQLGQTLLRAGLLAEGLAELRRASASDPKLMPQSINLAWILLNRDPRAVDQALQPKTQSAHLAMATFLAAHGKSEEALTHVRAAGALTNEQKQHILKELLAGKHFLEAYEIWSSGRRIGSGDSSVRIPAIVDGGFEESIGLDDPGFGWQVSNRSQSVRTSLDPSSPNAGSYSLRVDWNGDSDPSIPTISQLLIVEPNTRYRLSFAARTHEMRTIGLPVVAIADPASDGYTILKESEAFARGTSGWRNYSIEFTSGTASAVQIIVRRQQCETTPCAALGHAWVDSVWVEKL